MTDATLQPQPLGALIDSAYELREEKNALSKQVRELDSKLAEVEAEILERLDKEETTLSRGRRASAAVSEQVVPQVIDWDALYRYIHESDQLYLLQRRVASAAYRELLEQGEEIPGTEPFTKRTVNLRKI